MKVCVALLAIITRVGQPKKSFFPRDQNFLKESFKGSPKKHSCEITIVVSEKEIFEDFIKYTILQQLAPC